MLPSAGNVAPAVQPNLGATARTTPQTPMPGTGMTPPLVSKPSVAKIYNKSELTKKVL